MKALIKDNKVLQIETEPFPVHKSMVWVDCPDDCGHGWGYVDGEFLPPPGKTIDERRSELAAVRYEKETSGVVVDGFDVATDRNSQQMLLTLSFYFGKNSDKDIYFKGKKTWKKLKASEFDNIISAVVNHIQACFKRERELSLSLESDINTDINTGWPV